MTELERLALLGDRKAQEKCARKGILLPCPLCGGKAEPHTSYDGMYIVQCTICGCSTLHEQGLRFVFGKWNTRPAPPIGRCKDCLHYFQMECLKIYDDGNASADARQERKPDDFCSYFEPKENANE